MKVLVVDVGGTSVRIASSGRGERRKFASGPAMTGRQMVAGVKNLTRGWQYDRVSIGYPGVVKHNQPATEPHDLGNSQSDKIRADDLIDQVYQLTRGVGRLHTALIMLASATPPLIYRLEAMVEWAGLPLREPGTSLHLPRDGKA
jgi:hypothetical protein